MCTSVYRYLNWWGTEKLICIFCCHGNQRPTNGSQRELFFCVYKFVLFFLPASKKGALYCSSTKTQQTRREASCDFLITDFIHYRLLIFFWRTISIHRSSNAFRKKFSNFINVNKQTVCLLLYIESFRATTLWIVNTKIHFLFHLLLENNFGVKEKLCMKIAQFVSLIDLLIIMLELTRFWIYFY